MGIFGKIKNILFEDEDELGEMPVYTKEEVLETQAKKPRQEKVVPKIEEPIKTTDNTRFKNVKRDIDLNFDESDVLGEVPGVKEVITREESNSSVDLPILATQEENKSPFLSFDEDEFERLNSRITKHETRVKKEVKSVGSVGMPAHTARKANNNFSATSTNRDTRIEDVERYKLNTASLNGGRKPFTPSPVISPVYGILDKNYTKEDIIEKKGGIKRERVVKPIIKKTSEVQHSSSTSLYEVDIDSVRKKAYGELEDLERTLTKIEIPELKEEVVAEEEKIVEAPIHTLPETKDVIIPEENLDEIKEIHIITKEAEPIITEEPIAEESTVEEQLDEKYDVSDIKQEDLIEYSTNHFIQSQEEIKQEEPKKSKLLDELEKTSTLQILDDIEKELNSIKPIAKNYDETENDEIKEEENTDTLENDLFHLIDSMYQEGEEEEEIG